METIELGAKKTRVHALQGELAPSVEKKKYWMIFGLL